MTAALIVCDHAAVPARYRGRHLIRERINQLDDGDLTLRIDNVSHILRMSMSPKARDLLNIAAYVYAADQIIKRGPKNEPFGDTWHRQLILCIPVKDPRFWSRQAHLISRALRFATDDSWAFHFSPEIAVEGQLVFNMPDVADLQEKPDSVVLFSGGADSLCATLQQFLAGGRPALVGHRPAPVIGARQQRLAELLREAAPSWAFPLTSVWVHRKGSPPNDSAQRSRGFLFASLGAAIAECLGTNKVVLADNGIVSLNLPINDQIIGAKASRGTHPKFLTWMNQLLARIFPDGPRISNPLADQTRAESLEVLKVAGCEALLQETNSCSNWRGLSNDQPHCGACYQCIDRRFATLIAGLEEHDLQEKYVINVFKQDIPEGDARTVAVSYLRFVQKVRRCRDAEELFRRFDELADCVLPEEANPDAAGAAVAALVSRHASAVFAAMERELMGAAEAVLNGNLPEHSLLRLMSEADIRPQPSVKPVTLTADAEAVFLQQGFKSRLPIEVTGTLTSRKSNLVLANGNQAWLDDADFIPFLRLCLATFQYPDGFLSRDLLQHGQGIDSEEQLMPRGFDQALFRMRRPFAGRIGTLKPTEFIEVSRGRVRISTSREFLRFTFAALKSHQRRSVRVLAGLIEKFTRKQRRAPASRGRGKGQSAVQTGLEM